MKPTLQLLQQALRITLFTRANCSLCDNAKVVLSRVWEKRPFEYHEIDVMKPEGRAWKDLYEFDTPVIHIRRSEVIEEPGIAAKARKLMHRFTEGQVEDMMEIAEKEYSAA
ncbi:MAG: hypothetical protein M1813_004334 [Trichoglossum hirsutum]|nr:MAG: hypothetical protein M1813_004334 [Trichoglossum hirsutum]